MYEFMWKEIQTTIGLDYNNRLYEHSALYSGPERSKKTTVCI